MSKPKSWEIPRLSPKKDLSYSAKTVLKQRLNCLLTIINKYLTNTNSKNLHAVRISLRRVRYPMELFLSCFDRKKYLNFYKAISKLQDLSGEVRDMEIFTNNISVYFVDDPLIKQKIFTNQFEGNKERLQSKLKLEIMKFVHGKNLKELNRMIKNHV